MDLHAKQLRDEFWANDARNGSPIGKPYKEISFLSESSYDDGLEIRQRKLSEILSYARKYCAFYKDMSESSKLSDFPVMNKLKYIENYDLIKVDEILIPGQVGPVHIQTTSGSTGTPFAVPQDTLKRQRRVAELKYFGKIVGFDTHEMLIHLRTWNKWQSKTPAQIKAENIIPFDISEMGDEKLAELCKTIIDNKALCLRGYASSFDLLAKYVKKNPQIFPSLKICIAGSEALHDDVRSVVKETLGCEIISQYANEECGILAQERIPTKSSDNPMYFNYASYFFEVLKMNSDTPAEYGELGRIVITDLHNHAFPIIRYDNGDVGILSSPNEYSNGYPVLQKLYGRRFDVCYTVDNKPFFPMTIGRTLKHYDDIAQWQFVQKSQNEYLLKIVMRSAERASDYLAEVIPLLKETLGSTAIINIEQVDDIPVLASGKRKPVVNEWKKQ
mgnify:FL=1